MGHGTARTTVRVRYELCRMIEAGVPVARAARQCGTSRQTAYKWLRRYRAGEQLADRSSRPHRCPAQVSDEFARWVIEARKATGYGPARLGGELGVPGSTVHKVLRRAGVSRLPREIREPVVRYERRRPGELLHVDSKKLGRIGRVGHRIHGDRTARVRGVGWEHVHVAVDDRTRLAYVEIASDEKGTTCAAFLERACDWFEQNGIVIERVLTDNAFAYTNSAAWKHTCQRRNMRHLRTRAYRPQTNGKAERFIRTLLNEWAYADAYASSDQRGSTLPRWCDTYNTRRYHTAIKTTPWQRAASDLAVNNVCGHYT